MHQRYSLEAPQKCVLWQFQGIIIYKNDIKNVRLA